MASTGPATRTERSFDGQRGVRIVSNMIAVQRQPQHLMELAALCAKGAIRPPETEVLPMSKVADAHRLVEAGHVRGKVILATRSR